MSNLVRDLIEKQSMQEKEIPEIHSGDTVKVHFTITEGGRKRTQIFEGVIIAIKNSGMSRSFTVRKISFGIGVERIFPLYSPKISEIEVVKQGKVRRGKLYYLRDIIGQKGTRIKDKVSKVKGTKKKALETKKEIKKEEK